MIFLRKTLFFEVCFFESVTEFEFLGTHVAVLKFSISSLFQKRKRGFDTAFYGPFHIFTCASPFTYQE